jgi:hypothetical protein
VWTVGLWVGARSATRRETFADPPGWMAAACCALCLFFVGIRWGWLGPHLTQQALGLQLDKWQIGPLRVINLVTFSIVVYWLRRHLLKFVAIEPFLTLGKASLRVFYTHILFVFVGLALLVRDVGDDVGEPLEQLHGLTAILLVAITFTVLILVATHEVRKRRGRRANLRGENPAAGADSSLTPPHPAPSLDREIPCRGFVEAPGCTASLCTSEALPTPVPAVENSR